LGLYNRIRPRHQYHYFICHHKADAAAQARLLKMKLQAKTHQSVFIDSDNLTELDDLFDIVKCRVKHLVVYLTKDTLGRPWCAGEIATAFHARTVKVTAVRTPSFLPPTENQLERITEYLDLKSCDCALEEYGISFDHVRDGFRRLLSEETPQLRLKEGGVHDLDVLVDHIAKQSKDSYDISVGMSVDLPLLLMEDLEGAVVISCDQEDIEATAAATILNTRIQERVLSLTDRGTLMLQDYQRAEPATYGCAAKGSHATIVLLSQGSMKSATQLHIITDIMSAAAQASQAFLDGDDDEPGITSPSSHGMAMIALATMRQGKPTPAVPARGHVCPVIVPVFIDGFRFPDDSYYTKELPGILPELAEEARPLIQGFFHTIALPFSTGASDHVLEIQSQEVLNRIPKVRGRPPTGAPSPGSSPRSRCQPEDAHKSPRLPGLPRLSPSSRGTCATARAPGAATSCASEEDVIGV